MNKKESLEEQLGAFGLNRLEAKIYLYLLNKPAKKILEIAQELSLPRTSVYDNSFKLIEKGLIKRHLMYKSQKFQAAPLNLLQDLIDKEQSKINKLQDQLTSLEAIISLTLSPAITTEVRYYHGRQGFQQLMWNALAAEKETIGYSTFGRVEVVGEAFVKRWQEELIKKDIKDRVITTLEEFKNVAQFMYPKGEQYQQTRVVKPDTVHISGDTTIYNNVFAVCYWKQGEVVGVEIENAELVKTQKSIFEALWKLAEPIEKFVGK